MHVAKDSFKGLLGTAHSSIHEVVDSLAACAYGALLVLAIELLKALADGCRLQDRLFFYIAYNKGLILIFFK